MNWPSIGRGQAAPAEAERLDIALFPLNTVFFPDGVLSLKIFEPRYLDMAAACLKNHTPFGVCLIASGQEVGAAALPHPVGTLANIAQADMAQQGILLLTVRGDRRFRIVSQTTQPDGLLRAQVELLAETPSQAVPAAQQGLLALLQKIAIDLGPEKMPEPHRFDDAAWVGYRLSEVVPVQALAKQKLLELDDPRSRLEVIFAYLAQRKLV
jgi:uncharacterized protein